jgi:hypothetical protein
MARPQQQQSSMLMDMRTSFNIVTLIADVHTACIRPLTRSHQGPHALGWPGFWAMLAIPLYAGLADAPGMLTYWYFWTAMVAYRRLTADRRQHTEYQGRPWMFAWFMRDELNMRALEAATMPVLAGVASAFFGEDVGTFISAGIFSFGFRYVIDSMTRARRIAAARNARIEMEQMQGYYE